MLAIFLANPSSAVAGELAEGLQLLQHRGLVVIIKRETIPFLVY